MLKVILCTVALILSVRGDDPTDPGDNQDPPPPDTGKCDHFDIVCEGNSLKYCVDGNEVVKSCISIDPTAPFCDCNTNTCSKVKTCDSTQKATCKNVWETFPHPQNCSKYLVCKETKIQEEESCAPGYSYDPMTKNVVLTSSKPPCSMVKCLKAVIPENIPFPSNPQYYLACRDGSGTVQKCQQANYIMSSNKCSFGCTKIGSFVDPVNCKDGYYYNCKKPGTTFIKELAKCTIGKAFDESSKTCTVDAVTTCDKSGAISPGAYAAAYSSLIKY